MYFKQILNEDCGCASYMVASRDSHECAVVDPALDIQPYLEVMADRAMTLRYIVDTHLHADHVSGNRRLSGETGVPVSLHESADVVFPFERLRDGQRQPSMVLTGDCLFVGDVGRPDFGDRMPPPSSTTVAGGCSSWRTTWRCSRPTSRVRAGAACAGGRARPSGSSGGSTR